MSNMTIWQYDIYEKKYEPPPFGMTNMQNNMNPPPFHMTWYAKYEPPPSYICIKTKNITFYGKYEISNRGYPQRVPPFWHFFRDTEYVQYVKYVIVCTASPVGALPQLWTCSPAAQPWYWFYSHCATKHNQCCGLNAECGTASVLIIGEGSGKHPLTV